MNDVTVDEAGRPVGLPASSMPEAFSRLHDDAVAQLQTWTAPDAASARAADRVLSALADDPTAAWRFHSRAHLTASLVVLDPSATYVALTLHAKAKRWFQFGGHLEADDVNVAQAALREGVEESGLRGLRLLPGLTQVDVHELPSAFRWCSEHLDLRFTAVADRVEPSGVEGALDGDGALAHLDVSDESDDVRWFALDHLPDDTEASLRQAIELSRTKVLSASSASPPELSSSPSTLGDDGNAPGRRAPNDAPAR